MTINTHTLTTRLIKETTTTVAPNKTVSYNYPETRTGLTNNYSVLGLIVSIETTKQRGWTLYETAIRVAYRNHVGTPDGFSEWLKEFQSSFNLPSKKFIINSVGVERHSATRLQESHDIGVLAGESFVLAIINKYVELLFNAVETETITRQINELQSQLATLTN